MSLEDITGTETGRTERRRVGRGIGSGLGKTGGRGYKGEGSRTGGKNRGPLFEGGQFPFWMRLPKRGFSNFAHTKRYQAIPLDRALERISGDEISLVTLIQAGLIHEGTPVKLVSGGEKAARKVSISVNRVTASVRTAVEAAGGSVSELDAH